MRKLFRRSKTWQECFEEGRERGATSDFAGAETSFREAVRLAPEEPYPHYELGYTLALLGRHEEALEEFRRTEQLRRGFFVVETEISMYEQLLSGSIDNEVLEILRSLQRLTDDGADKSDEAVALSRQVIDRAPECALGHFHLGKARLEREPRSRRRPFAAASTCIRTIRPRSMPSGISACCARTRERPTKPNESGAR